MSEHYEADRVECGCGEIYANNYFLKLHILEAENKALKEELKTIQDIAFKLTESLRKEGIELGKVKDSRNELLHWLEAISVHVKDSKARNAVNLICARAEALKEKEAK